MLKSLLLLAMLLVACAPASDDTSLDTPGNQALSRPVRGEPTRFPIVLHHGFGGGHAGILAYNRVAETHAGGGVRARARAR